ncbi:MAG TPA: class I SAM-dependent methyltransferase [Thermoanaerobaculia bacterium]|nr:class I SAM-dependent methyltransferase [Thermoanaerobaculia bacterium]
MRFADHFSGHAADYARYRPAYPPALFEALAALVSRHTLCWDAGTGSGQAACGLADHFAEVVATDASAEQIAHATPCAGVTYRVAPADQSGLDDATVDLVTVGQAVHWFSLKSFYEEVRRVGAPGSVIAVWAYDLFTVSESAAVESVFRAFHSTVEAYWPPERALVARRYADLLFPFEEIPVTPVTMTAAWSLERVLGYLSTWSSVKAFTKATGEDPVAALSAELTAVWGDPADSKTIAWPLILRTGRIA